MPELSFVTAVARSFYALEVQAVEPLVPYCSEWRGLYRLRDAEERAWMMRMWRGTARWEQLRSVVQLLDWLTQRKFPATPVLCASDGQLLTVADGWFVMIVAYIEGEVLGMVPAGLEMIAQIVGRLHTFPLEAHSSLGLISARCHPDRIAVAAEQLDQNRGKLPADFHALGKNLHGAMVTLAAEKLDLSIVHGDCWYQNAIQTGDGRVALIDWDLAGIGSPLLELGNLLLTSHFDFNRVLSVEADEAKIRAILLGYQQHCRIQVSIRETLANAMRFLLAYQLGSYVADDTRYRHPEFPFVLQKLQARYDAIQEIANLAEVYLLHQDGLV